MQINISTRHILQVLLVISWIIFIGLCVEAGSLLFGAGFALAKPAAISKLWQLGELSDVYRYDHGQFFVMTLIMSIVAVSKAWLFFMIIKILLNKKLSLSQPFSQEIRRFTFLASYLALLTGIFSSYGIKLTQWLVKQGAQLPDTQYLYFGGADVWLFMSVILFVIAQLMKRGIEIQTENELTI